MLVLSRRIDEKIIIGGQIVVQVVSIDRGCVRLGITAPSETTINREEIEADKQRNGAISPRQPRPPRRLTGR